MAQTETPGVSQQSQLDRLGFTRGNPFATMEADREREILDELFVDIDNFERIRAARTAIVHAPRGCGKSAVRVRLTNDLAPWTDRPDMDTFAIEFLHFDSILARQAAGLEITTLDYVDAILHEGARALAGFLLAPGLPNSRLEKLDVPGLARLGRLAWSFAPDLFSPENAYERFKALMPGVSLPWTGFRAAMRACQVTDLIGPQALSASPQASALAFLLDVAAEDRKWSPADPDERLELLVDLVQRAGYHRLTVMVDRVDEIAATASDPLAQAALIEPLMAHLPLMEMPGVSFKFFIPTDAYTALLKRGAVRPDRLDIIEATVDWSESRLQKMLAKRLMYFSGLPDFSQNTSTRREDRPESGENLGEAIERELILIAGHSPRLLIRAGQLMLDAYLARPGADLLTWSDWGAARKELMPDEYNVEQEDEITVNLEERPLEIIEPSKGPVERRQGEGDLSPRGFPYLHLSRRGPIMRLKGLPITLSDTELKIMRALLKRNGMIDQEKLVDEVWNGVATTQTIDVALKRIRDEIDTILGQKKTALKYYLMKKSGSIMLDNYRVDEEF